MRRVHLRVVGRLDGAGRTIEGTVVIDRNAGLFEVRPLRRHRTYTLPLSDVADMVVARIIRGEVFARRLEKKRGRR